MIKENHPINIMKNNIIESNEVIGNTKKQNELIFFRQKQNENSNIIRKNKIAN